MLGILTAVWMELRYLMSHARVRYGHRTRYNMFIEMIKHCGIFRTLSIENIFKTSTDTLEYLTAITSAHW